MKKIITFSILFTFTLILNAQTYYRLPVNNPDQFLDNTSMKGFSLGSGAVFGFLKEINIVSPAFHIFFGYNAKHLYFDNKMIFEDNSGSLTMYLNDDPSRDYPDKAPKKGYTRLTGQYFRFRIGNGILATRHFYLTTGINTDIRIASKYKHKWYSGDTKKKEIIKGNNVLKLNNVQFSWYVELGLPLGIGIYYERSFNEFMKDDWGANVKMHMFGISIGNFYRRFAS
ncbi:MAG: hypothetical protein GY756_00920 [bacterium]|nr:hypothetical protein [bacterium]